MSSGGARDARAGIRSVLRAIANTDHIHKPDALQEHVAFAARLERFSFFEER
jgi:hypothetical protein